jgi:predicted RNase H-like nuclease (RuvC/YqgF family)
MFLVASLRAMGQEHDAIIQRLEKERENQWESLPELPPTFFRSPIPNVPIDQAASRAYEMAQAAALQTQIQYLQQQNQDLTSELESARTRVNELETELEKIRQDRAITERDLREELLAIERQKQTALLQAQAEVARLEGQLSGYSLGREKPLNVGLLLIGAVLFGVALVVVVFVIANLLG